MDLMKVVELGIVFSMLMVHNAVADPESDLIEKLPGQREKVPFKQYGGYITIDEEHGRALFYYFVEAHNNATSRPLVLWLSGGPGASSLGYGAFIETGPFRLNGKVLEQNKFSWNTEVNMLYVESPIGVGFSYSNTTSDYYLLNDTLTAGSTLLFLLNWFKKFPMFRDVNFYITRESYAGHYIPQLATLVIDYNKKSRVTPINLKGIAIGNPLFDIDISVNTGEFLWSHGLISDETYQLTQTICNNSRLLTQKFVEQNTSEACTDVFNKVNAEIGYINRYDVTLGICLGDESSKTQLSKLQGILSNIGKKNTKAIDGVNLCAEDDILTYFNKNEV
ncbi:serine carboxypeptidase-like 45 [Cryptomeria japonica]|uniref:serine carboxypeptidase-like 45 n=1 Tax=Cryptomeria japonica TaxID=3369 RepID=UPI0027DA95E2|nr:serine carboxypeptidase-like 45 [Cryptomeria japonica]